MTKNTLHFETHINAPAAKVWDTMLQDATYREWTKVFSPNSYYEGPDGSTMSSWDTGSKIHFLDGSGSGMYSEIAENRLHEFVSIRHLGMIADGTIDTESEEVKKWASAYENYTLVPDNDGTKVIVDIDITPEYEDMFKDMWPKALEKLKELAEA